MSRPIQIKNVGNQVIASSGATINSSLLAPSVFAPTFPVGDMLMHSLDIRLYGNENNVGAGSATAEANGPYRLARAITFETDKHGKIVDGVDGLSLELLATINNMGARGYQTLGSLAAAGTPAFEANIHIDLSTKFGFRPYDSALDLRFAKPALTVQAGVYTELNDAGFATTNDIQNLAYNVMARILNGPIVEPGGTAIPETPDWMRYYGVKKYVSTATTTGATIDLTWGDRIFKKIMLTQRGTAAGDVGQLLANTVLTSTASVSLLVNSFPWGDRIQHGQLQATNKADFGLETVPSGYAVLDFDSTGRYADYLSVLSRDAGIVQLQLDVTGVASSELWIVQDCYKAIPDGALRASQLAARGR